jgi:hypothetical protein
VTSRAKFPTYMFIPTYHPSFLEQRILLTKQESLGSHSPHTILAFAP